MPFYNEFGEPTIAILDHGVLISTDPTSINFAGAGVVVSQIGSAITVTIAGGGGGGSIGSPIVGGHPNDVLFIDAAGNLAQDDHFYFNQTASQFQLSFGGVGSFFIDQSIGTVKVGDYGVMNNGSALVIDDFNKLITIGSTATGSTLKSYVTNHLFYDEVQFRLGARFVVSAGAIISTIGDVLALDNGTVVTVNDSTKTVTINAVTKVQLTTALLNVSYLAGGGTRMVTTDNTGNISAAAIPAGTVTSVSFTGGLITVANPTTTPAFTVAGTSGGIPYFSSTSTWASSALLAANALMIGGGAGTAPSTTTTGTGVLTALGVNVGSAGAFVTFNGALGTPSSGVATNLTGTATALNIGGTAALATNMAGGLGGQIPYQTAVNTSAFLANGTAGQVLQSNGTTLAPSWVTPTAGTVTSVTGTANRITSTGGATPVIDISAAYVGQTSITTLGTVTTGTLSTGAIIGGVTMTLGSDANYDTYYRNSSGVLTRLANGTTGQVLTATTSNAPTWAAVSAGANTALSNLVAVSINTSLLAQTGVDLGSTANPFRDLYLFGSGTYGTTSMKFTGTPTGNRVYTFPDRTNTMVGYASGGTFTAAQTFSTGLLVAADIYDGSATKQLAFTATVSAVNAWNMTNSATGSPSTQILSAIGSDTNINAEIQPKGSGKFQITDGTDTSKKMNWNLNGMTTAKVITMIYSGSGNVTATIPNLGTTNDTFAMLNLASNQSFGNAIVSGINLNSTQLLFGVGSSTGIYRNTNAGANVQAQVWFDINPAVVTAGKWSFAMDNTNGFAILQANGTRRVEAWGFALSNQVTTAASESADLTWYTQQTAGAAVTAAITFKGLLGQVGIGVTSPTAMLHLKAGSATAATAPLKFNSGTLMTSAEAGAMEYLTDAYYVTTTTGAVRRMIVAGSTGRATAQTAANTSVATYTLGATDASYDVSANVLVTTSSAENFTVTCSYTDEGNTARVLTLNFQTIAAVVGTAINFANGAVPYEGLVVHIRCKASSTITIKTTGTFTGATYNCEGIIRQSA